MWGLSWLDEELLLSQEGLSSLKSVILSVFFILNWNGKINGV